MSLANFKQLSDDEDGEKMMSRLKKNNSDGFDLESFESFEEDQLDVKSMMFHEEPSLRQRSLPIFKKTTTIRVSSQSISDES